MQGPKCQAVSAPPMLLSMPGTSCLYRTLHQHPLPHFPIQRNSLPLWETLPPSCRKPSRRKSILPAVCTAPWHPPKLPGSLDSPPPAGPPGSAGSTAAGPPHLPMRQGKSFRLRWGLLRHWDTPTLSLPCPQLTQAYSPPCSKSCLATGAPGPI